MDTFRIDEDTLVVDDKGQEWADFYVGEVVYPNTMIVRYDGDGGNRGVIRKRQAFIDAGDNGYAVSVVWGTYTYSDNNHKHDDDFTETPERVEVGVVTRIGLLVNWWGDNVDAVRGNQTVDQVNELIQEVVGKVNV